MLTKILLILVKQVPVSKHSTSNPKAYSKGRGSEKQLYYESPAFYIVMVVSDGLRSTFIWLKFQNFPGGASPQTPYNTVCYMCTDKCAPHTPHASHQSPLCIYTPFFILWINPWVVWIIWNSTYVWLCHRIRSSRMEPFSYLSSTWIYYFHQSSEQDSYSFNQLNKLSECIIICTTKGWCQ